MFPRCLIRPRVARGVGRVSVQCCRGIYPPLLLGAACWAVLLYTAHCCWAGEEEEPLQPGVSGRDPPPHTTDTTITTHQHTLTTGPMWQYQPGDTAAMLTNVDVGHGPAITGHRCIFGGCSSRQYTYFELWILIGNRKQRHSLLLFRDFKKSTDSHFCW